MIDRRYESGKSFVMYSKEELEAARRTDMVTFLESHEGFSFKSSGGWYIGIVLRSIQTAIPGTGIQEICLEKVLSTGSAKLTDTILKKLFLV